ncbi:MAG TPA: hypothetical protein DEH78_16645 [Solibacterales bacterium]|nr:hypothetical protein [Bryobacterales bacterium]
MSQATFVLPVYNGTRYLREAIDSVLAQSVSDWTLLIVDDCSSDRPEAIVSAYRDARIRFVRNSANLGLYGTLVRTIPEADSPWISIIMQDDRLKPEYLREMVRLSEQYPAAQAIWAGMDCVDGAGALVEPGPKTGREEPIAPGPASWRGTLAQGCMWTISGSFTRKQLYQSMPFRTDLPHCGDYEWLLRAIREVLFVYWEYPLVDIRLHEGQASTGNLRSAQDVVEAYGIVRDNFRAYPGDLPRSEAFRICRRRARGATRRALKQVTQGRVPTARLLLKYAFRFAVLPFENGR